MTTAAAGSQKARTTRDLGTAILLLLSSTAHAGGGIDVELGGTATPVVAVSPTDLLNVAYASYGRLRVSTDGGETWQPPVWARGDVVSSYAGDFPSITFDSQGRLFWVYVSENYPREFGVGGKGSVSVQIVQCDASTGAILPGYPINVPDAAGEFPGDIKRYACLAADTFQSSTFTDALYVAWKTWDGDDYYSVSGSTDQGLTWSPYVQLGGQNSALKWLPHVAVAPNGDVYVSQYRRPATGAEGTSARVNLHRSTDGGLTFPQQSTPFPAGTADRTENVQNLPSSVPGSVSRFWPPRGTVLADPQTAGRIFVITDDDPDDDWTSGDASDIFLVTSTDHGMTWSAPTRIDDGPGTTFQVLPAAAIDPETGDIVVTYYQNRSGDVNPNGNDLLDLIVTVSTDGGQSFTAGLPVNDTPFDPDAGASSCCQGGAAFAEALWGSASDNVFGAGLPTSSQPNAILRYDGVSWWGDFPPGLHPQWDVSGTAANDVFIVGGFGKIWHYDGSTWSAQESGFSQRLRGVWCDSSTDCFAVGVDGTILHYDGNTWSTQSSGTLDYFEAVWGSGPNDVLSIGEGGTILRYNGSTWSAEISGTLQWLFDVWGASATDVFAVGSAGTILHYDGSVWTGMNSGTGAELRGVWGTSGSDVFAVGTFGTILHYDGTDWSPMESGSESYLRGVWGSSGSDVWVVGPENPWILHYDGTSWSKTLHPLVTDDPTFGIGYYNGVAIDQNGQIHAVWCGNTTDDFGAPLDQEAMYDRFNVPATGVEVGGTGAPQPARLVLERSFPNPFATATTIGYRLPGPGPVQLTVYDVHGRRTASLVDHFETAGRHTFVWDGRIRGRAAPAGVYFLRLQAAGEVATRKISLFR